MFVGLFVGFTASLNAPLCYLRRQGYRLQRANIGNWGRGSWNPFPQHQPEGGGDGMNGIGGI